MPGQRGGWRRGAGRKPMAPEELRRHAVMLRFSDSEYEVLTRAAGSESVAAFLRAVVMRATGRRRHTQRRRKA